jgi:hypothetical protein
MRAVPLLLCDAAVIVAAPAFRAVTCAVASPVDVTTATEVSLLVHVAVFVIGEPLALVAVSVARSPMSSESSAGVTVSPLLAAAAAGSTGAARGWVGRSRHVIAASGRSAGRRTRASRLARVKRAAVAGMSWWERVGGSGPARRRAGRAHPFPDGTTLRAGWQLDA